jgi:CHAD domain-containing protein
MALSAESANMVIIQYLSYYFDHFKNNLEKAKSDYDDEAIHQYRVAIKRIRSVFRAINKLYPGNILADELLVPLREMFKAGGAVRDEQVQLELVIQVEETYQMSFPLIKDHYNRRIENSTEAFRLRSRFFDRKIMETFQPETRNALIQLDENDLQSRLYAWIDQSMEKLRHRRFRASDPYKLHRFRTRFKELSYLVELVYGSKLQPNIDKATYQKLKNFGQELGDWHDHFQLWSRAGEFFRSTTDIHLLEESFQMKKLLTPVHDKRYNDIQEALRQEDLFTISFASTL